MKGNYVSQNFIESYREEFLDEPEMGIIPRVARGAVVRVKKMGALPVKAVQYAASDDAPELWQNAKELAKSVNPLGPVISGTLGLVHRNIAKPAWRGAKAVKSAIIGGGEDESYYG